MVAVLTKLKLGSLGCDSVDRTCNLMFNSTQCGKCFELASFRGINALLRDTVYSAALCPPVNGGSSATEVVYGGYGGWWRMWLSVVI